MTAQAKVKGKKPPSDPGASAGGASSGVSAWSVLSPWVTCVSAKERTLKDTSRIASTPDSLKCRSRGQPQPERHAIQGSAGPNSWSAPNGWRPRQTKYTVTRPDNADTAPLAESNCNKAQLTSKKATI